MHIEYLYHSAERVYKIKTFQLAIGLSPRSRYQLRNASKDVAPNVFHPISQFCRRKHHLMNLLTFAAVHVSLPMLVPVFDKRVHV